MVSRLETELSRHLAAVAAPEELWARIEAGAGAKRALKTKRHAWPVSAAVAATIGLCWFSFRPMANDQLANSAWQALASDPEQVQFRSADPAQIRAWVKAEAGLDIPLAGGKSIQYIGASVLHASRLTACVSYRVGQISGKLLVARDGSGGPQHPSVQLRLYKGAAITSWAAAGQTYALASPAAQETRRGCVLCHMEWRS